MINFLTRTNKVLSLLLLVATIYCLTAFPAIYAKLLALFETMSTRKNIIICSPFAYLFLKPLIKIKSSHVLLCFMVLGIFYNIKQYILREDYLEPDYVLRLFNNYNLHDISKKSSNTKARNKLSLYFGLREFIAGSEVVINQSYHILFSPLEFQNIARIKKMTVRDYEEELSEASFMDLIRNDQTRKIVSEEGEILILPNLNNSYHLFTYKNKLILMAN